MPLALRDREVTVCQAKAGVLDFGVLGQTLFGAELLDRQHRPASLRLIATRNCCLTWTNAASGPRLLIHERDATFSRAFGGGIRTPFQAPNANAHIERWIGSVRRECRVCGLALRLRHYVAPLRGGRGSLVSHRSRDSSFDAIRLLKVCSRPPGSAADVRSTR